MSQSSAETSMPEVIGHRGAKGTAPENTLASVRAAKDLGLGWVEVDVMLSKDKVRASLPPTLLPSSAGSLLSPDTAGVRPAAVGPMHDARRDAVVQVPVIHHDLTLDRCTTGKGNVSDYTWDQLQQLDAGSYFGEEFAGERIPQLRELISICREMALQINLEVKYLRGPETRDHPTAAEEAAEIENANRVCDVIEEMAVQPRELVFSSFSRAIIGVVRSRLSTFKCSYLVNSIPADWEEFVVQHQVAARARALSLSFTPSHSFSLARTRALSLARSLVLSLPPSLPPPPSFSLSLSHISFSLFLSLMRSFSLSLSLL